MRPVRENSKDLRSLTVAFVTDALLRKSVVVCRALARQGIEVAVGSTTRLSPGFFSRYRSQALVYPSPTLEPEAFVERLLDYLRRHPHAVLIPVDDATVAICSQYLDHFNRVTRVPIPSPEQLKYGLDKGPLMQLAETLGIPHPNTVLPKRSEDVARLAANLRTPLVVKPRTSSAGRGIVYLEDTSELTTVWERVHQTYAMPMIQECIPNGRKFDVGLLINEDGRCVASFVQEELRHFPLRDGMSTLQVSVARPDLVDRALALLRAIGWYGLAEVEFMEHPHTGELLLLELNPRVWASIQLAVACGVNFPYLLHQLAIRQPFDEIHDYMVGRRCRWLLPGDLLHFLANSERMRMQPSFFDFTSPETVYDGLYRDDLPATVGVLMSSAHYLFDKEMWRMVLRGKRTGSQARSIPIGGRPPVPASASV